MSSRAISGFGTKFRRWDLTLIPAGWRDLAEITSISGPGMARETIDVTSLDSIGGYREFIASIRNGGTVSLTMNFRKDSYELMKSDFESDLRQNYQIALPDEERTALEFEGLVMELPLNITVDDKITCDVTIQISGRPDLTTHILPV